MSTPLASISQVTHIIAAEPEPHLPLLCNEVQLDTQTEVQRAVQANLQTEIDTVIALIENPQLREVSQTILSELSAFSTGSTASKTIFTNSTPCSKASRFWKSSNSKYAR